MLFLEKSGDFTPGMTLFEKFITGILSSILPNSVHNIKHIWSYARKKTGIKTGQYRYLRKDRNCTNHRDADVRDYSEKQY